MNLFVVVKYYLAGKQQRQAMDKKIATAAAKCEKLDNELRIAKSKITDYVMAVPESAPLKNKGCFTSVHYSSADWAILDADGISHSFTVNENCKRLALPCSVDCPYRQKNNHYADLLAQYDAACAAYYALSGRKWKKTK